jgi:peptidyl-prolyl cis-trans isomerase D
MFDFVRQHNKIMQFLLVLLIFPSFVLFGIDGYNRFREKGEAVAVVASQDVTQAEWDNALRIETQKLRESMPNIDPKFMDSPEVKYEVLERIVRDKLLSTAASKLYLNVSDQKLASELQKNPTIASLRKPDGSLDLDRYKQLLASQGLTPESFEARMRSDLAMQQVIMGIAKGSFIPTKLRDVASSAFNENREIQVQVFKSDDYLNKVKPTQEELQAYYDKHTDQFQSQESADIEYVVLDLPTVEKSVSVNESELKAYFEQNSPKLGGQEERRASHILITVAKDASSEAKAKARAKAQELLAEVRKAPQSFAEVAKKNSQDPVSAAKGGDLDFFAKGAMVKAFEDAAFAMQKGQISDVVESDFGYHIIKLTDIKAPKAPSFEELRPSLEAQLRKQGAQKKFAEDAELFSNLVYEQSDSLKAVTDKLKLETHTFSSLTRSSSPAQIGPFKNPKLLSAIFSADCIEKKHNTEAVEVAPNNLVSARITKYVAARTLSFEEVKGKVESALEREQALKLAKRAGQEFQTIANDHPEGVKLTGSLFVSRQNLQKQPQAVVEAALRAPTQTLPSWTGVDLGADGYAVIKVVKVVAQKDDQSSNEKKPDDQNAAPVVQAFSAAENLSYYNFLKTAYKTKINAPSPASVLGIK